MVRSSWGNGCLRSQERLYELTGTIGAGDESPDKESRQF